MTALESIRRRDTRPLGRIIPLPAQCGAICVDDETYLRERMLEGRADRLELKQRVQRPVLNVVNELAFQQPDGRCLDHDAT